MMSNVQKREERIKDQPNKKEEKTKKDNNNNNKISPDECNAGFVNGEKGTYSYTLHAMRE